ncbi:MAG: hypothetical protein KBF21_11485 [Thermoanaerobaculia bacterium]|nr:hypothetical protein [Thermoanaerobaculia bacterium]MBP9824835.1 hypothetical protein [Thermoanaerobaculia bacterium]
MSEEPTTNGAGTAAPAQLQGRLFAMPAAGAPPGLPASLPECAAADSGVAHAADTGRFGPPWAGVCISGGGSRSLSAAMGELRGLAALGVLPQIGWLSTVSGGTWAGTLYNWAPGIYSDAELLGPLELDPAALRWDSGGDVDDLGVLDPHAIGSAATRLGLEEMLAKAIELYHRGVPVSELWPRAIGELVLEPFDLGDTPQRYFTWTKSWLERRILADNPALRASDFLLTRPDRPYLITNSTLFYPPNPPASLEPPVRPAGAGGPRNAWEVGYDFETTPISAGIPPAFPNAGAPNPGQPGSSDLGGGWIDPFTMGSIAPSTVSPEGRFRVPTPPNRFRFSDAAGLSSVAFVYDLLDLAHQRGIHFLDDMVPETTCWPVYRAAQLPRNAARPYLFGDGGNLENQGIMALLRRRLKKVLAFVNTETQLSMSGNEVIVDSDLPPLFGLEWSSAAGAYVAISPDSPFRNNQVFDRATFDDLRRQLWNRAQLGATAMAVQKNVPVLANAHFGIQAGTTDLLWIYLHPVNAWRQQLHDTVKIAMDLEPLDYGMFPNYYTVDQLHLNARQVNLLAHLTSWNVASEEEVSGFPSNAEVVRGFVGE